MESLCLQDIVDATNNIKNEVFRTPLVKIHDGDDSHKMRGACNAVINLTKEDLEKGVYSASMGNFSQGLAWICDKFKVPCDIYVPENASKKKIEATERFGARVTKVSYDAWWRIVEQKDTKSGKFIHPVCNKAVMAGNGTIGLEILEDLPEVDAVVVPYGGGALSCGIATAVKSLRPQTKVYAAEVETGAPLAASLAAGKPTACTYTPSFVDSISSSKIVTEIWPMVSTLLDGCIVVTLKEVAAALKLMVERNHVVAEGGGATAVAAALSGKAGSGNVACVVTGGNIDTNHLIQILQGNVPDVSL